jgi:hypothetical protein
MWGFGFYRVLNEWNSRMNKPCKTASSMRVIAFSFCVVLALWEGPKPFPGWVH